MWKWQAPVAFKLLKKGARGWSTATVGVVSNPFCVWSSADGSDTDSVISGHLTQPLWGWLFFSINKLKTVIR